MKYMLVLLAVLCFTCPVRADLSLSGGYDYYMTPNEGNNFDDAQGFNIRLNHPIVREFSGALEFSHIGDIDFEVSDDPKGSWGQMRGYGALYDLKATFPVSKLLDVYATAGAGMYVWDFRENPLLQDNHVKVDVDPSLAYKAGAGLNVNLNDSWTISGEVSWFDSQVPKDAKDENGVTWNILDDDNIGLQYICFSVGGKYKF